jgi:hypothetical protein
MREEGRRVKSGRFGRWTPSLCWGLGLAMAFVMLAGLAVRSQSGPPRDIINRPAPMPSDPSSAGDYDPIMMERRMTALNNERQKEMVSDTNKLLKLAKEVNDEIAARDTGGLTPDQLHKIAEIEKLARGVKDKMADGTGQTGPSVSAPVLYPNH